MGKLRKYFHALKMGVSPFVYGIDIKKNMNTLEVVHIKKDVENKLKLRIIDIEN
jgi:hypothetical protein